MGRLKAVAEANSCVPHMCRSECGRKAGSASSTRCIMIRPGDYET